MIGKYISELLYRFDSVTLPGFGTFMKKSSAHAVHPVNTIFAPSVTDLTFDTTQQDNDGVLANYIAEKENLSFFEALEKIRLFIQELNLKLNSEKVFSMPELGTFSMENGQLIFTSKQDLCFDSTLFGLTGINAKPILRPERKLHISESERPRQPIVKKKKRTGVIIALSAIVLVLLSISAVFIFKPYKNPKYSEFFNSIPGFENKISTSGNSISEKQLAFNIISKNLYRLSYISDTSKAIVVEKNTIEQNIEPTANYSTQTGNYVIVAGSFKNQENADKYVSRLKAKGYAPIILDAANGMHMVCYGSYSDLNTANQKLQDIKASENPEAWIFKH